MRKILEILKSKEQRWILIVAVITTIALAIALPFGYINLVKLVFNFFVRMSPLEFILLIPLFFLLFNVIFKWKINLILIGLCSFFSKKIVNSLNCFVGFCLPLFLMNLGFNHIPDALFFATIGLTTYLIAIASHWIILDLETQSNDLVS